MYDIIDPSIRDEIIEGGHGDGMTDVEEITSFLDSWSKVIAEFITIIRTFFNDIKEIFAKK